MPDLKSSSILLLTAGLKGAVGSTLAAAVAALDGSPEYVLPYLTTAQFFPELGPMPRMAVAGWDVATRSLVDCTADHGVLPPDRYGGLADAMAHIPVRPAPAGSYSDQVDHLCDDIAAFAADYPDARPVFVNLLPAADGLAAAECRELDELDQAADVDRFPDAAYVRAAVRMGLPVVNFSPNPVECPALLAEAAEHGAPMAGRDGKTGQTYFKVVLASAFRARALAVDGWYSLNILGNADGLNLQNPDRAAGKLANKTDLLDDILGYRVGGQQGAHKVHIDYYPPRGDAKEAWDVIDIQGLFGMPMSLRVNLLARDSILAAPLVLDVARWVDALGRSGRGGAVPELAFYFKRAVGGEAPGRFEDQLIALRQLAEQLGA